MNTNPTLIMGQALAWLDRQPEDRRPQSTGDPRNGFYSRLRRTVQDIEKPHVTDPRFLC